MTEKNSPEKIVALTFITLDGDIAPKGMAAVRQARLLGHYLAPAVEITELLHGDGALLHLQAPRGRIGVRRTDL